MDVEAILVGANTKEVSFIMKIAPSNAIFHEVMKVYDVFEVETAIYRGVVDEYRNMYRKVGIDIEFMPNYYRLDVEHPYLLLEDLSSRGFKNMPRLDGLDTQHTEAALKKLAQWHAASAHRIDIEGPFNPFMCHSFLNESLRDIMKPLSDSVHKEFLECAKSYRGVEERCYNALQRNVYDELIQSAKEEKQDFCVLNHGDFWSNNIMFQHDDEGNITETFFVDFQGPRYGTPAQDLYTLLLSSTQYDIKLTKFDYFVWYYHRCLVESLQTLNYRPMIPTLKDLHIMLHKYGIWGYHAAIGSMATVLLDSCEEAKTENFLADTAAGKRFKNRLFTNSRYRQHIEMVLPWLYNRGAI
ncbi:uncharacterized protein LOC101901612 [Musca domestica]|uniref:Uncharacterized protein LOC101901612 n=1 Tax=Musca domestica TaxID=7370 RepID=A0ABM3V9P6_MUSDO|nr:uncharacterized protein LOC101901612 [Musca domestica]